MADVSKIKLPNQEVINIKDSRITGIDSTPTFGSTNVVTSGGVYNALNTLSEELAEKQDAIEAINVSVDNTSGTPSGSASMSGNTLSFSFSGIKGNDGATGQQGPVGPAGANGTNGADGKSAYQIWLDAGHQGTEADFLASLQGNPGSSQDYPFELENSLNGGTNKALSAYQGKVLDGKITQLDEKLEEGLEPKVDKEEGKSLIDAEYAASKSTIDNPEYLAAWVDAEGKVIFGLKTDGKTYVSDGDFIADIKAIKAFLPAETNMNIDWDALASITAVENPEFVDVEIDSSGKIISSRDSAGIKHEKVGFDTPKLLIGGEASIEIIRDPEGRTEILTDAEEKIISYRDSDGVKHEEVGMDIKEISTDGLKLTENGMSKFQQALKDSGFNPGSTGDWSDYISDDGNNPLCIPEPKCAIVNIISDFDLTQLSKEGRTGAQKGVNYEIPTQIEFWDMQGNYFKKWTLMSGQGASTMARPKKNIALDLFDKEADGDAFKIKFGDWIAMDSFHLKAYVLSTIKVKPVVVYRIYKEILETRGVINNFTWKKGAVNLNGITPQDADISSKSAWVNQFDNGATCFPDGFPCVVYQNGEFFGIYMWQIKKARDNYKMNKKTAKHIHLDGELFDIFSYDGNIDWDVFAGNKADSIGVTGDIEIRNPKDLYLMNGTKYNADTNRGEIMDSSSPYYDSSNANHVRSNNVKNYLLGLSRTTSIINAAKDVYEASEKTSSDLAAFKAVFETYFDKDNLIDYLVISDVILNWDGFNHNAQWTTWDGVKWFINMYDVDNTFGGGQYGAPTNYHIIYRGAYTRLPMFLILLDYYLPEIHNRYRELREAGVLSSDHICELMTKMQNNVSSEYYLMEFEKWSAVDSLLTENDFDSIYRIKKFLDVQINNMDVLYNYKQ